MQLLRPPESGLEVSPYLIWMIRCERVIRDESCEISDVEVSGRWHKLMKDRAEMDVEMTDYRLGKKAIPKKLVRETWAKTGLIEGLEGLLDKTAGLRGFSG